MATLRAESGLPKYFKIKEILKRSILEKDITPGSRLLPFRQYAKQFKVTMVTISKAMEELEREGLIQCIQGKGTFVRPADDAHPTRQAVAIMPTEGHFFASLFGGLVTALDRTGFEVLTGYIAHEASVPLEEREAQLARVLSRHERTVIVDGYTAFPFTQLHAHSGAIDQLTFINRFETDMAFPGANRILTDSRAGGRLAARHLVAGGARRLLFYGFRDPAAIPPAGFAARYCYQTQIHEGFCEEAQTAGLSAEDVRVVFDAQPDTESALAAALRDGYHAVFCMGDFRAARVYQAAAQHGLRIGAELQVMGYFDTPWSEAFQPALTSVSIDEANLAAAAATALAEGWQGRTVMIAPRLVERVSTRSA